MELGVRVIEAHVAQHDVGPDQGAEHAVLPLVVGRDGEHEVVVLVREVVAGIVIVDVGSVALALEVDIVAREVQPQSATAQLIGGAEVEVEHIFLGSFETLKQRLVITCVVQRDTGMIAQWAIAQGDGIALPAHTDAKLGERLLVLVVPGLVASAVVVETVEVASQVQVERAGAVVVLKVQPDDIVIELLLEPLGLVRDELRAVLAGPGAVVLHPHAQRILLGVDDAVAGIAGEVDGHTAPHLQVAPLVAEVVRRAVAVGQHRGDARRHSCGLGPVAVA